MSIFKNRHAEHMQKTYSFLHWPLHVILPHPNLSSKAIIRLDTQVAHARVALILRLLYEINTT